MSRSAEFGYGTTEQRQAEHQALVRRMQDEDRDYYQSDWEMSDKPAPEGWHE